MGDTLPPTIMEVENGSLHRSFLSFSMIIGERVNPICTNKQIFVATKIGEQHTIEILSKKPKDHCYLVGGI